MTLTISHHVLIAGNNLSFEGGFFGLSSVVLVRVDGQRPLIVDTGHHCTRRWLIAALARHGLTTADIGTVFLSHLHFDHVNNIDLFPNARVLISRREWDYAYAPHADDDFIPWLVHEQLKRHDLTLLDDDGEISPGLRHFAAPGHTPGLQALVFVNAAGERVVLASDAIKTVKEILTGHCEMAFDTIEAGNRTIERIRAGADRIVPGHSPELRRVKDGWTWDEPARLELIVR